MTDKRLTSAEKLEIMEKHMRVSWSKIDSFFEYSFDLTKGCSNTRVSWGEIWAENKYPLFKLFKDRLVIEKDVENTLTHRDISTAFRKAVFYEEFSSRTVEEDSILGGEGKAILSLIFDTVSIEEIHTNIYGDNYSILGIKVSKGMKITRSLKFFIKDKKQLDLAQTSISRFIQSLEAKGKMMLSIDPMDILCMSVNEKNSWRSCHHVINGEYSGGAPAYMLDASSAIAQTVSDFEDNGVPNKTWRQMVIFDDIQEVAMFCRQYPTVNQNNRKTLQNLMKSEISESAKTGFVNVNNFWSDEVFAEASSYHYNDVHHGALEKVGLMVLNPGKFNIEEEAVDNSKEIMRNVYENGLFDDLMFEVGINDLPVPDGGCDSISSYSLDRHDIFGTRNSDYDYYY